MLTRSQVRHGAPSGGNVTTDSNPHTSRTIQNKKSGQSTTIIPKQTNLLVSASSHSKKRKLSKSEPVPNKKPRTVQELEPTRSPKTNLNAVPTTKLKIYPFGTGESGELGFGNQGGQQAIEAKTPRLNPYLCDVVQMALGGMHGIALTSTNDILTWGVNDQFALGRDTSNTDDGDGDENDLNLRQTVPTAIDRSVFPLGTIFVQVCAGDSTSFALTVDGLVYGWGIFRDSNGLFGFKVTEDGKASKSPQERPRLIEGLRDIKQIACGGDHGLALDKDGNICAWGAGEHAQLGRPLHGKHLRNALEPLHRALTPLQVQFPRPIASIAAGANHSFGIDNDGHLYAWGLNNFGQCGIPQNAGKDKAIVATPRLVEALKSTKIKMIAGGNFHSIAVTEDGDCLTWGKLDNYQSGIKIDTLPLDDERVIRKTESGRPCILLKPTKVPDVGNARYVVAGSDHCLVTTVDGKIFSWGFNGSFQCGQTRRVRSDEEDLDEIKVATPIQSRAIGGQHFIWADAGGQFSAVASIVN